MLDADFRHVVKLRAPRAGSRRNGSEVVWDPVLSDDAERVRISCRFKRSASKTFGLASDEEQADATMLFRKTLGVDVSRENLVVDDRGEAYKVLRFREEEDLELDTIYKEVTLKKVAETFPGDVDE